MTAISSVSSNYAYTSPRDLLQNELTSEVSAGTISAGDQDALSSALDSIDSALKGAGKADRASGAARPSPDGIKSKIDDLIASQVSDGKLTSDQADELKNVFAKAFGNGPQGPGGPGGPAGPGGPPPDADSDTDTQAASGSTDTQSTASKDLQKLLSDFLKLIQDTTSKSTGYTGTGQTQTANASLLFDYQS